MCNRGDGGANSLQWYYIFLPIFAFYFMALMAPSLVPGATSLHVLDYFEEEDSERQACTALGMKKNFVGLF